MAPQQQRLNHRQRRRSNGGEGAGAAKAHSLLTFGGKAEASRAAEDAPSTPPAARSAAVPRGVTVDALVKTVYKVITKRTELDWGLTSDWKVAGKRKRVTRVLESEQQPEREPVQEACKHGASEGYGEMTEGSIQRLLNRLRDIELQKIGDSCETITLSKTHRLTKDSTFIDVGSGYGKVVMHAALDVNPRTSTGIEMVASRHELAEAVQKHFLQGRCKGITVEQAKRLREGMQKCIFRVGDATAEPSIDYSHVYMYDYVFNELTLKDLALLLNKSAACRILVSYRDPAMWRKHGLTGYKRVDTVKMNTTGGQNFTAHVYAKL